MVSFRLVNQREPNKTLQLSNEAWFRVLDIAAEYGWNPLGTGIPGWWYEAEALLRGYELFDEDYYYGGYTSNEVQLVMLEDALNLADALERAFLEYDPEPVHRTQGNGQTAVLTRVQKERPSIGAITTAAEFCQQGAFWIERY